MPHEDLENEIASERQSIDLYDIWRSTDDPDLYFSDDDPFSRFLRNLVKDFGDIAEFDEWSFEGTPSYFVCIDEAARLVGGNRDLAKFILRGDVALNEMPKELYEFDKVKERTEWIFANVGAYLKARNEELEASINKEAAP